MSEFTPIHEVYRPLYENKDKFIILITGGRGSGKSFEVARFIERLTFELGRKILFTRYTMTSADKSIIPEVVDKIERDGTSSYFRITKNRIVNNNGSEIIFMGIRASSGNQTAKLKSIQGVSVFVCDEGEEWLSDVEFDKLILSIREKGVQNMVIIVMNPSDSNHFVYKKYIENSHKEVLYDGVPVQISTHPNVLHIHTTYLDNICYLSDDFIREVEDMKANNPVKYAHVAMGRWADFSEGAIFKKFTVVDEIPSWIKKRGVGIDFGYTNDVTAIVECALHENDLYIDEVCYETHMLTADIINRLKPYKHLRVMSESADPRLVQEIKNAGILIYPVSKYPGSILAGIDKLHEYNIHITKRSFNAQHEARKYVWDKDKDGNPVNAPIDAYNHCWDAIRYWVLGEVLGKIISTDPKKTKKPSWMY